MRVLLAVALAASVILAACGGSDSKASSGTKPAGAGATQVTGGVKPSASATSGGQATAPAVQATAAAASQQLSDGNAPGIPELKGEIVTTASGLRYIDEQVGTGDSPKTGQAVTVQYTGWLTTGKKFDSSRDRNQPFTFNIGQGRVIKGWDEGVATMKIGGKRRLIIPASLGYGASGSPPVIPANATLIFDVELLSVK
jgi:peptidylprolyl isomerase